MANPFKNNAPKKPPVGAQDDPKVEEVVTVPVEPEVPEMKPADPSGVAESVIDKLVQKKKKKSKKSSVALYLSDDNMKKLATAAKKAGLSKSEFVDQLLKELL